MSFSVNKSQMQHLYWRAGFGSDPAFINKKDHENKNHILRSVMRGGETPSTTITVPQIEAISLLYEQKGGKMSAGERREIRKTNRQGMQQLNLSWIDQMAMTDHPLREKMAFFWHGHFACRVNNVLHNQLMLDVIRQNALGNFKDLLFAVSKSPAMLQFLNNQQNKKQHPNENFGREVMELFTMGHGNYTEKDVKEGSRAFTGWSYNRKGEFVFRKRVHDEGLKTFLGKTGHFTGDDVLHIILEQKATARHITNKIYRFFVNDTPDENTVNKLAEKFYQSNYNITGLMETIFKSDEFYQPQNKGNIIKSPVELLVGMRRTIPVDFGKDQVQLLFQRLMDQVLFYPPNVGGWPGGRSWIDSSTLLFRMRLPQIIYYSEEVTLRPKDMPDELTDTYSVRKVSDEYVKRFAKKVKADVNWDRYISAFKDIQTEALPDAIAATLLSDASGVKKDRLNNFTDHTSRENYIKSLTIDLMSTPEYQLC